MVIINMRHEGTRNYYFLDADKTQWKISQTGTLSALSIYEWEDGLLMCSYLPDSVDNYYAGRYDETENEIRLVRLTDEKISEEERYKYGNWTLHRTK